MNVSFRFTSPAGETWTLSPLPEEPAFIKWVESTPFPKDGGLDMLGTMLKLTANHDPPRKGETLNARCHNGWLITLKGL